MPEPMQVNWKPCVPAAACTDHLPLRPSTLSCYLFLGLLIHCQEESAKPGICRLESWETSHCSVQEAASPRAGETSDAFPLQNQKPGSNPRDAAAGPCSKADETGV